MKAADDALIQFLFSRHRFGLKPGLERVSALLDYLGHPERKFQVIHVAGTNGKGTTAAFLESLLGHCGVRTGLYTSPHLVHPEERIRVNREKVPREEFVALISDLRQKIERVEATFFEAMTAIGFAYFAHQGVEVAVVEVGLGGRWDATNVVSPAACVITDVHLDHQVHLGRSVRQIAGEKAGIMKAGVPCFTYVQAEAALKVMTEGASKLSVPLLRLQDSARLRVRRVDADGTLFDYSGARWRFSGLKTILVGRHQARNAGLALLVLERSPLGQGLADQQVCLAISSTRWDGRFQILSHSPKRVVDVAHNVQGVRAFAEVWRGLWPDETDGVLVIGLLKDKAAGDMFRALRPLGVRAVVAPLPSLRSASVQDLAAAASQRGYQVRACETPWRAWQEAERWAGPAPVFAVGSHYLVGEILQRLGLAPE